MRGKTFYNINRLFVLSLKSLDSDLGIDSYDKYYLTLVEMKDFNVLIDQIPFFDQPIKSKQEAYEKLVKKSRNDDYTKENLYHQIL